MWAMETFPRAEDRANKDRDDAETARGMEK